MAHSPIQTLLDRNLTWSESKRQEDPQFFSRLVSQQNPEYLWIGCADSRVPANEIVDLQPGELFVHRNVANLVVHSDLNCLSVLQYAVEVLKVKHVLVVGHYGCGGVRAALNKAKFGLIDNWLRHVQDISNKYHDHIQSIQEECQRVDRLCELNVIEQVYNVCRTTIVEDAWDKGQPLTINGWTYSLNNGLVSDLKISVNANNSVIQSRNQAVERLFQQPPPCY